MQTPLRVAVTGAGGEARWYSQAYQKSTLSELILMQDIDEAKAREQAERFGTRWTSNYNDLLASDADIIDVSTPNHLHREQTVAALEAGKHVICQKPMAPGVEDCQAMIDAAERTGKRLGIYMSALNDPFYHELKRMIQGGFFGIVSSVGYRGAHRGGYEAKDRSGWRGSLEKTGGGAFIQLAIHGVNLMQWILGEDIVDIAAKSTNRLCKHSIGGDDLTHAVAEFEGGAYGTFEAGYAAEGGLFAIYGTKGSFVQAGNATMIWSEEPWESDMIHYTPKGGKDMTPLHDCEIPGARSKLQGTCSQHEAFLTAVIENGPLPVPASAGMRDVAIVKAVYRSAEERRSVSVAEMIEA